MAKDTLKNEPEMARVLLVLSTALGWRTYSKQLSDVAEADRCREFVLHHYTPSLARRMLVKHHNVKAPWSALRVLSSSSALKNFEGASIREVIRRASPDVIHFVTHELAAAHAFRDTGIPFTVTMDTTKYSIERLNGRPIWTDAEKRAEGDLLRRAARVFAVSQWAATSAIDDCGVPRDRVSVVPASYVRTERPIGDMQKQPARLPRILFVGNDFRRKGGHLLHRWVTGPLRGTCELHIVSHDRHAKVGGEHVICHGGMQNRELIDELMPQMDILCHPTQSDMSAFVVIEAARAELPSVASSIGGVPDLILEGETGYLVDPRDELGFIARLRLLIDDQDLRVRMGRAAKTFADATFDAEKNFGRMLDEIAAVSRTPTREQT